MDGNTTIISGFGALSPLGADFEGLFDCSKRLSPVSVPEYLFLSPLSYPVFVLPEKILTDRSLSLLPSLRTLFEKGLLNRTSQLCLEAVITALDHAGLSIDEASKHLRASWSFLS